MNDNGNEIADVLFFDVNLVTKDLFFQLKWDLMDR
jgi:hypothetical protein